MKGLYIHVPFCKKICGYCDFATLPGSARLFSEYVDLLLREAERRLPEWKFPVSEFSTSYFGGGTPSELPASELAKLVRGLETLGVDFSKLLEVNIECNPDSADLEFLETAHSLGVNRFSLGLQTFDDFLLQAIGRRGTARENREALARLVEFTRKTRTRASADLMFWLPGQSLERFRSDVSEVAHSGIGHVSFYGLTLGANTVLENRMRKGRFSLDENLYPEMYEAGVRVLRENGIERYEVSNFAKPGEEGLHNRNYWRRGEYLGLGPGAHSFDGSIRSAAPARYTAWKRWVEDGCPESSLEKDAVGKKERIEERIWLSLRTREGLDLQSLDLEESVKIPEKKIERWMKRGYLERNGSLVRLLDRGWLMMDAIVEDLMPD